MTSSWPTLSSLSLSLFLPTSLSFFLSFSLSLSLTHTHTHREIYNKTVNVLSLSHWLTQGEDLTHCQDSLSQTNSHKQKSKANFYTLVKDTLSLSFSIYFVSLSVWQDWAFYNTLGNFFKPCGNNYFAQIAHIFGNFFNGVEIFHFSIQIILGNFYRHLATFYWSHCSLSPLSLSFPRVFGVCVNVSADCDREFQKDFSVSVWGAFCGWIHFGVQTLLNDFDCFYKSLSVCQIETIFGN